jgi:phospholipase/lecithinase/hemolysin
LKRTAGKRRDQRLSHPPSTMKAFVAAALWSSLALASPPSMQHIENLVTFGDSYADLVRTGDPGGVT